MSTRGHWLVCYDIADQKRWRYVYRIMRGFGKPMQYSIFHCELSEPEKIRLTGKLEQAVDKAEDRILMIPLGSDYGHAMQNLETIGRQEKPQPRGPVVL